MSDSADSKAAMTEDELALLATDATKAVAVKLLQTLEDLLDEAARLRATLELRVEPHVSGPDWARLMQVTAELTDRGGQVGISQCMYSATDALRVGLPLAATCIGAACSKLIKPARHRVWPPHSFDGSLLPK